MSIRSITFACALLSVFAGMANAATITVLSSQPKFVSGGDALVFVAGGGAVTLNGTDVTGAFKPAGGDKRIGLVQGLKLGANTLAAGGTKLIVTNHSIAGPMFSGPHETPFQCMTDKFFLPASKQTLGAPLDSDCAAKTRVDFVYRSKNRNFKPLPSGAAPDDVAQTTTTDGKTVPYIVRVETGTINRAIYQIALLAMPGTSADPMAPPPNWNGKLIYPYGGGCGGGWYVQGAYVGTELTRDKTMGPVIDFMIRQGYAVASATLNNGLNSCAMVLGAETTSMVKERFIKDFGVPKFTIGIGCSSASEFVSFVGDNYPGLLDGVIIGCSFADMITSWPEHFDAKLLVHYFKNTKLPWTAAEKGAAGGYPNDTMMVRVANTDHIKAENGECDYALPGRQKLAIVPPADQFSAETNPKGVRCGMYDHGINVFGRDPKTGYARRTMDNEGIEYGLGALKAGTISSAQFLDLNRNIGGTDNNDVFSTGRTAGDPIAIKRSYEGGLVTEFGLGLKSTPIIDYRAYVEMPDNPDVTHSRFQSFSIRERLLKSNGSFDNDVMEIESGAPVTSYGLFSDKSPLLWHTVTQMDEWLSGLDLTDGKRPSMAEMVKAKPADLVDACFTEGGGTKIAEPQVYQGDTRCNRLYPAHSTPRMVAGESLINDVLKCQLKPITAADHGGKLNANDLAELKALFPKGVCDYSKPGVNQVPAKTVWPTF